MKAAAFKTDELLAAVGSSLLLHGLLLFLLAQGGYWQGDLLSGQRHEPRGVLHVVLQEPVVPPQPIIPTPVEPDLIAVEPVPVLPVAESAVPQVALATEGVVAETTVEPSALGLIEPYFTSSELDELPRVKEEINPYVDQYANVAQRGELVLRLWIDQHGKLEKIEVVKTDLSAEVVELAMKRFKNASYFPAQRQNRPVNSQVDAVLRFDFE